MFRALYSGTMQLLRDVGQRREWVGGETDDGIGVPPTAIAAAELQDLEPGCTEGVTACKNHI